MTPEEGEAGFAKAPSKQRSAYKRDVVAHGLDSQFVKDAIEHHEKLLKWIDDEMKGGPYLAGDTCSLADVAVIPYILRLELLQLSRMWDKRPGVAAWWERVRRRPSTGTAIFKRMMEADAAPFKNLQPDPWPKVRSRLPSALAGSPSGAAGSSLSSLSVTVIPSSDSLVIASSISSEDS